MMNELEKMQRAKMYMDKLAEGINPLTDTVLSSDTTLNNVNLARCFFYVAEVLAKVIDNGGEVGTVEKVKLDITDEQKSRILVTSEPVGVNEIARRINAVINTNRMKGITGVIINNWLVGQGLLRLDTYDGKQIKVATTEGEAAGITTVEVAAAEGGTYKKNLFSEGMQKYIIDRLAVITKDDRQ